MRVLVVDDHRIIFAGLKILISQNFNCKDIQYASNESECFEALKSKIFDLIILDLTIPKTNTLNLFNHILAQYPDQKVLIFSQNSEEIYAKNYLKLGAFGYLKKDANDEAIIEAVSTIMENKKYISRVLGDILANDLIYGRQDDNPFDNLSSREMEILIFLLKGLRSKEISVMMNLHSSTIGTHKSRIFSKLQVSSLMEIKELTQFHELVV